ncbi:Phosphoserine phosphatase, variant 2 [Entomophthora muscae]|uniref:Phosphoserine phosphatase, variant 2 n=1 Tax=Entomophthora muscae TaxID=34485 RepID=A0ACC2T2D7_9FUNG|nr:Phosphoserine phosphatase, variant 2 [Entomophthora muscae]
MSENILKLVATTLLDLKKGSSYKKLELVLKKLENEGLFSTQITLLSDLAVSECYSSLHDSTEGLAYEIFFECRSETKLYVDAKGSITHLLSQCRALIHSWKSEDCLSGLEFSFQDSQIYTEQKKLFIFDMDSTLIQQEVIDEMAKIVGVGQQVSEITESAMRGEIDFKTSLKKRVALLSGAPTSIFDEVRSKIELSKGAKDLCSYLKSKGCILAVVSGGFLPLANYVKSELNLDYAFANQVCISKISQYVYLNAIKVLHIFQMKLTF